MSDLIELARRYVSLSDELESVRDLIKRAVVNGGAGPEPRPTARPSQPVRPSGQAKSSKASHKSSHKPHPKAIAAMAAETEVIDLLKSSPGLKTVAIAKATSSKTPTMVARLARLQAKGQVHRDGDGGFSASV